MARYRDRPSLVLPPTYRVLENGTAKMIRRDLRKGGVSRRTFKAFDNGLEKIEATAETMEEAIQIAFDIFGERTLLWNFRWVD